MKIIKNGTVPPPWTKQVVCTHCGAVLEISARDLSTRRKDSGYITCRNEANYVCPCCFEVNAVTVPHDVATQVRKAEGWGL